MDIMKTTLEIPDPSFRKAKARAAEYRNSIARIREPGIGRETDSAGQIRQ
jgi:hypothetical protein